MGFKKIIFVFMTSVRQEKVAELIKQELSLIFQKESRTLCLGSMVSVTVLRISPDLGVARVYVSIFAAKDTSAVFESIQTNASLIRRELGRKVSKQLRKVPELYFFLDDSLDYAEEIDDLLKK